MKNTSARIIFIAGSSWDQFEKEGFRTRQGALLSAFSRSGLCSSLVLCVETGYRGECSVREISRNGRCRIWQVSVPGRLPELPLRLTSQRLLGLNYRIHPELRSILANERPSFIFSYSSGLGHVLQDSAGIPLLYDVIDYRATDPNLTAVQRRLWTREIGTACGYADIVVCNGERASAALQDRAKRCVVIRNGVDPDRFSPYRASTARKGVGFVGVISGWIDFDLIETLLQSASDVDFQFYGIVKERGDALERLKRHANFHWKGELPPSQVPEFLSRCQVGIVPYDLRHGGSIGDSMKIFEYLAAGTPVITTAFQSNLMEKFAGLIEVCQTHAQFAEALKRAMARTPGQEWSDRACQFIQANAWQRRVEGIFRLL